MRLVLSFRSDSGRKETFMTQKPGRTGRVAISWGLASWVACTASMSGPSPAPEPPEIMVYAATSLRDALQDLTPRCQEATGVRLVFNFGASSDLARQIVAGNKADIFFSADESWMDKVAAADLVDAGSRQSPLSNRLVVVVPKGSELAVGSAGDLAATAVKRLSLANP